MSNFDDVPITTPDKDRFGFDPFAQAISDCIRSVANPLGSVVAIYGPWGSGKSSVLIVTENFCGCRPWCKRHLTFKACDRERTSVRPRFTAFTIAVGRDGVRSIGSKSDPRALCS